MAAEMRSYRPVIIGRARRRRGQPSARRPGRALGAAGRRQRGRRCGRDGADARRRRADDVGARRRRVLPCLRPGDRPRRRVQRHRPGPAAATPERYAGGIPRTGPLSVSVPGTRRRARRDAPQLWPAALARPLRRGDRLCPRRLWRDPRLQPFRRRIPGDAAGRPAQRRNLSRRRQAAAARRCDRAAGPRPHARGDRLRRRGDLLPRPPGAAARGRSRGGRDAWSRRADLEAFEAEQQEPIGDRLPRLHGARGAAQLDRLRAAPGAEDRREFRSCRAWASCRPMRSMSWSRRKSSPSPTASAGAPTRARSKRRSRELLSADYAAQLAGRIDLRRAAPTGPHGRRRRRHDLFLHRRRRGQCRLRRAEHQQRLRARASWRATPASCSTTG